MIVKGTTTIEIRAYSMTHAHTLFKVMSVEEVEKYAQKEFGETAQWIQFQTSESGQENAPVKNPNYTDPLKVGFGAFDPTKYLKKTQ